MKNYFSRFEMPPKTKFYYVFKEIIIQQQNKKTLRK